MNRIFFTLFFTVITFLQVQAGEVRIRVIVENPLSSSFSLQYKTDLFSEEANTFVFDLGTGTDKTFELEINKATLMKLGYAGSEVMLFLEPGDQPEIRFNGENVQNTISFQGKGAANNRFFFQFQKAYPLGFESLEYAQKALPSLWDVDLLSKAQQMDEVTFMKLLKDRKNAQLGMIAKSSISSGFSSFLRNQVNYSTAAFAMMHYVVQPWLYDKNSSLAGLRKYGLATGFSRNENHLLDHPDYVRFLTSFIYFHAGFGDKDYRGESFDFYKVIREQMTGKTADFLLTKLFFNSTRFGDPLLSEAKYPAFRNSCSDPSYIEFLDEFLGSSMQFDEEGPAPLFSLPDTEGKMISLSAFKGKVVYLSFWATWCKPCLKGFEKSRYIREELEKKGVVLINISVDKSKSTWTETMKRVPMPGINLISQDNDILRIYDISSLPVYHIIGKDGKFTYLPESSRNILEEFGRLVRE